MPPRVASPAELKNAAWMKVAGFCVGVVVLAFLMFLVLGHVQFGCPSQNIVALVCGFGAALSYAFVGGASWIKGAVPIPKLQASPVTFFAGGGVAVLIVVAVFAKMAIMGPCVAPPGPETPEAAVNRLHDEILGIRGNWEASLTTDSEPMRMSVSSAMLPKVESILAIPDGVLRDTYRVIKYEYAAYGLLILAAVSGESLAAMGYASRATECGDRAIQVISNIEAKAASGDPEGLRGKEHIAKEGQRDADRTYWLLAWSYAVQASAKCKGKSQCREDTSRLLRLVSSNWETVSPVFRARNPAKGTVALEWALAQQMAVPAVLQP